MFNSALKKFNSAKKHMRGQRHDKETYVRTTQRQRNICEDTAATRNICEDNAATKKHM